MPKMRFVPSDVEVTVGENESVLSVAQRSGLTDVECCGMNPLCGKCKFSIIDGEHGLSEMRKAELEYCRANGFLAYQRLGCLARVSGDLWVELEHYTLRR